MKTSIVASVLCAFLALVDPSSAQIAAVATTTYVQVIATPILLPSALFTSAPQSQYFSGDVRSSSSTTFYTVWRDLVRDNDSIIDFAPAFVTHYDWFGYTFSASSAGTQYVWQK